nr:MAG TPA_asm: hypothetical protein [Caudoviricetes sp.]
MVTLVTFVISCNIYNYIMCYQCYQKKHISIKGVKNR